MLVLYAGDSGEYDHRKHFHEGCSSVLKIAPRILDETELRIVKLRLHSRFNTYRKLSGGLGIRQADIRMIEQTALFKLESYALKQKRNLEMRTECPELNLESQIREISPSYQLTELGTEAQGYLHERIEKLREEYGDDIGNDIASLIKETFVVRDFYKKLPEKVFSKRLERKWKYRESLPV